jgi:deazaflavin-dependent oxidoreductase (nitroreductase family)
VWLIKRVVAPVHRWVYRVTGGRVVRAGRLADTQLLKTTGRRTGRSFTAPLFFVPADGGFIVCNVRPVAEPVNPWVLNLRACREATVQVGPRVMLCRATELGDGELDRYWARFVSLWPAYDRHLRRSGQRAMFMLYPCESQPDRDDVARQRGVSLSDAET